MSALHREALRWFKQVVAVAIVAAVAAIGLCGGASAQQASAVASKYCSAYAEEHFHDKSVRTPGGVKCLGVGEYCSHKRGYAKAYRRAGFRCNSKGRLEYR